MTTQIHREAEESQAGGVEKKGAILTDMVNTLPFAMSKAIVVELLTKLAVILPAYQKVVNSIVKARL